MKKIIKILAKWEFDDYAVFVIAVLVTMIITIISVWIYKSYRIQELKRLQIPLKI